MDDLPEFEAVEADNPGGVASPESCQPVFAKPWIADVQAARPDSFRSHAPGKGLELSVADLWALPFGLYKVCFAGKMKAAVDLLTDEAEGFTWRKVENRERFV